MLHTLRNTAGDIISLCVLGTDVVVLNTHKASVDLLEKRGSIYSGRPVFTVVGELMGLNQVRNSVTFLSLKLILGRVWPSCKIIRSGEPVAGLLTWPSTQWR